MKSRRRMSHKRANKAFKKGRSTKGINYRVAPMRGGWRL